MAPPPQFNDLGKSSKDLFSKGYTHGFFKLDMNAKSGSAVEFKSQIENNLTSQKLKGNLEVKYKLPDYGTTLTEKWNTDSQMTTTVEINEQLAKGLKVTLDSEYNPQTTKRGALVKTEWTGDMMKVNTNMNLLGGPLFDVSGVARLYTDWLVGGHARFDLQTNTVKSTCVAVGFQKPDYTMHSYTDGNECGGSVYHKVHKNLEYGWRISWKLGDQGVNWGFATKYQVNPETCLRAKIDNKAQVSVAATHKLSDEVKLTLGSEFGLTSFPDTTTKFGLGVEYSS